MSKFIVLLLLATIATSSCTQQSEEPAPGEEPDSSTLLSTDQAFAQLSADSGAVKAFGDYLAVDAVQMPNGAAPIIGRDSILAAMNLGSEYMLLWDPKRAEVAESGELGWTWGVYQVHVPTGDSTEITSTGKYLNIWRKQDDGSWKVMVDMGNAGM